VAMVTGSMRSSGAEARSSRHDRPRPRDLSGFPSELSSFPGRDGSFGLLEPKGAAYAARPRSPSRHAAQRRRSAHGRTPAAPRAACGRDEGAAARARGQGAAQHHLARRAARPDRGEGRGPEGPAGACPDLRRGTPRPGPRAARGGHADSARCVPRGPPRRGPGRRTAASACPRPSPSPEPAGTRGRTRPQPDLRNSAGRDQGLERRPPRTSGRLRRPA
jgi:hypothetical protein